jgi:hypothetical protein
VWNVWDCAFVYLCRDRLKVEERSGLSALLVSSSLGDDTCVHLCTTFLSSQLLLYITVL